VTKLTNNRWEFDGKSAITSTWKAVSESNEVMSDSVCAGVVTITSNQSITLNVSIARHGGTIYENTSKLVTLAANTPKTVIVKRHFSNSHNRVRLQIDLVEIDNATKAVLTIEDVSIVETLASISSKTSNVTIDFPEANKKFRNGNYHAALVGYLLLAKKMEFKPYVDNAIKAAHKLDMKWINTLEDLHEVME
jgi:hypothetical protein